MINVNQDAWNKLPEGSQEKYWKSAAEMEDEMWNLAGDMDRKSRATLVENGMSVDRSKAFRKATQRHRREAEG
jgi:TRAP-type C4-dicarboxylate transport system substrate-binding protein